MAKISVSLPDHLLAEIDKAGGKRSQTIASWLERYLALRELRCPMRRREKQEKRG